MDHIGLLMHLGASGPSSYTSIAFIRMNRPRPAAPSGAHFSSRNMLPQGRGGAPRLRRQSCQEAREWIGLPSSGCRREDWKRDHIARRGLRRLACAPRCSKISAPLGDLTDRRLEVGGAAFLAVPLRTRTTEEGRPSSAAGILPTIVARSGKPDRPRRFPLKNQNKTEICTSSWFVELRKERIRVNQYIMRSDIAPSGKRATFDEVDWRSLTELDKRAIRSLTIALSNFEPLAKFPRLGPLSVHGLIEKGLAEEGPSCRPRAGALGYRLTNKGWLANEWMTGNKMRVYLTA